MTVLAAPKSMYDAPTVTAGVDVNLVVEGGPSVGTLDVTAGRNIHIVGIKDSETSRLTLGTIQSTGGGDVTLIADDGLWAANASSSLVKGNRIELPWLSGKVVSLGKQFGVPTPVHEILYAILKPYIDGMPA